MRGQKRSAAFDAEQNDLHAEAANRGDRAAAGAYIGSNLSYLRNIAKWLSRGAYDPDDLVAESLASLLALWARGEGPTSKPNAYVIRSMRNMLIDEFRSPRSRVGPINETDIPAYEPSTRDADLHREYGYVLKALQRLSPDQQLVLRATIIDGRKPGELEEILHRPASAIYTLSRRARLRLRRATLQVVLEDGVSNSDCHLAAGQLPELVQDDIEETSDSKGMLHIRDCDRCRAAWARFASISGLLGVCSLLIVGNVLTPDTSAQAKETESPQKRQRSLRQNRLVTLSAIILTSLGAFLLYTSISEISIDEDQRNRIADIQSVNERAILLTVSTRSPQRGIAELEIDVNIEGQAELVLTLPPNLAIKKKPKGWECSGTGDVTTCSIIGRLRGTFVLSYNPQAPTDSYHILLATEYESRKVTGFASGTITEKPSSTTVSAR